jgi:hypothetical protein
VKTKICIHQDCPHHGTPQPISAFSKDATRSDNLDKYCKDCRNRMAKERRQRYRKAVLEMYGGKCVCCGEDHIEFLCLDHIAGGGNEYRRVADMFNPGRGSTTTSTYKWLLDQGKPLPFLQVLCYNCNLSKAFYGYSPNCLGKLEK